MKSKILTLLPLLWVVTELHTTPSWAISPEEASPTTGVEVMSTEEPERARLIEEPTLEQAQTVEQTQLQAMHKHLYESQGAVLFRGKKAARLGASEVTDYRLEEIDLPQPWKTKVKGKEVWANKAWRITITGGPFRGLGDADHHLGRKHHASVAGQESPDLSSISVVTFDNSKLIEGATIAVSYGKDGPLTLLPEKLSIGKSFSMNYRKS